MRGVLTTPLGALESGRAAFVEDVTGGIGLYLDAAPPDGWPAGTIVELRGTVDERYGQRTIRAAFADLAADGTGALPGPLGIATGDAGEDVEGRRLAVAGITVGSPSTLADGTGLLVDDGSGELRLIVAPDALGSASVPAGSSVRAAGPLGQRDSTGTGTSGYRLHAVLPGDFAIDAPPPSPTPTPGPSPSPSPTPGPSPTASPSPAPTATPDPTPSASAAPTIPVAVARTLPVGTSVAVRGVVTAEPGRVGIPPLFVIQDGMSGIVVRLPDGTPFPRRGELIEVVGPLADPYGQLEIRPPAGGVMSVGVAALPPILQVTAAELGETVEGRLVTIEGRIDSKPSKATSGDLTFDLVADGATVRVLADASSGIASDAVAIGAVYEVTGVVGQRASRKGALDGYRIWARDAADLRVIESESPGGPESATGATPIAAALRTSGVEVVVEADVTAGADLLDASGRRIVVEDGSAAVEVLLPEDGSRPDRGSRLRVTGTIGLAYGAPRLRATRVTVIGIVGERQPVRIQRAPAVADEWRLVRIAGTIVDVRRLGDRWLAEMAVGGARVPVVGLPGAGIAATAIVEGRPATITGIVRRPYPSATDRRFAVVPRDPGDVALGPGGAAAQSSTGRAPSPSGAVAGGLDPQAAVGPLDVDLGQLAEHVGSTVRVGGLVLDTGPDGIRLDDGTAIGTVALLGDAAAYLPLLKRGDAVNAIGIVERRSDEHVVAVRDPAGLLRVGDLGELAPIVAAPTSGPTAVATQGTRLSGLELTPGADGLGLVGLVSLVLATLASAAIGYVRRERSRRRLASRIAVRLASLDGPESGPHGVARATHEP